MVWNARWRRTFDYWEVSRKVWLKYCGWPPRKPMVTSSPYLSSKSAQYVNFYRGILIASLQKGMNLLTATSLKYIYSQPIDKLDNDYCGMHVLLDDGGRNCWSTKLSVLSDYSSPLSLTIREMCTSFLQSNWIWALPCLLIYFLMRSSTWKLSC